MPRRIYEFSGRIRVLNRKSLELSLTYLPQSDARHAMRAMLLQGTTAKRFLEAFPDRYPTGTGAHPHGTTAYAELKYLCGLGPMRAPVVSCDWTEAR